MNVLDTFLFVAFPYIAAAFFVVGVVYRRQQTGFKLSSLSSQFLEGNHLFWGSVPFHLGILVVFLGHLTAFLLPGAILTWNRIPARLIILEVTGFMFGVTVLVGLVALMWRRFTNPRVRAVTTRMDIAIEVLLLAEVVLGCWVALLFRWGSSWFAAALTPYLRSLVTFSPETAAVVALPWVIKLHIVVAFAIVLLIPFTRLVHFIVAPWDYIVRPYQVVIWNWDRKTIRDQRTAWSSARPKNN